MSRTFCPKSPIRNARRVLVGSLLFIIAPILSSHVIQNLPQFPIVPNTGKISTARSAIKSLHIIPTVAPKAIDMKDHTSSSAIDSVHVIPTAPPKEIYRKNYTPPKYFVKHIDVDFKLDFVDTQVTKELT